jgi:hypothetical protein
MLAPDRVQRADAGAAARAAKLVKEHKKVKLSDEELIKIANWIDANCPFYPSYWDRKNARFADHPDFRPAVNFADAISRTVPETIAAAEAQQKN